MIRLRRNAKEGSRVHPGGPLGEREESMTAGVRSWGLQKTTPTFLVALKADSGVMRDPLPDSTIYPSPSREMCQAQ
jgi:hypothetical protein